MSIDPTPLQRAVIDCNATEMLRLLDTGTDINDWNRDGESLLHEVILAFECDPTLPSIVNELIRRGASLAPNTDCGGVFFAAAIIRNTTVMRILLEAGANPNIERDGSETVYDWAEFDYRYEEYDLEFPQEPTPKDKESEESWLQFLERLAKTHGKRPPDYLRVLREFGAKRSSELEGTVTSHSSSACTVTLQGSKGEQK